MDGKGVGAPPRTVDIGLPKGFGALLLDFTSRAVPSVVRELFLEEEKRLSSRKNELGVAVNALQNLSANFMGFFRRHLKFSGATFGSSSISAALA